MEISPNIMCRFSRDYSEQLENELVTIHQYSGLIERLYFSGILDKGTPSVNDLATDYPRTEIVLLHQVT